MKHKDRVEAEALIEQLRIDISCMHQRNDDTETAERRLNKVRVALASLAEIIEES